MTRIALILIFGSVSAWYLIPPLIVGLPFGWDAVGYTAAARVLLAGGDPWAPTGYPVAYAAPPPSLLPFLPFVWMPDWAVAVSWVGIGIGSAVYSVRRLGLAWWWLLFPPLVLGVAAGSGAVLALALMVRGGAALDAGAAMTRIYAVLPLAILGRWRSLLVAGVLLVVTAPFLAWPAFFAARERVQTLFEGTANLSAFAVPWLIPVALICLILLGRQRAAWLIVPVLWPWTQPYYAVIALPALGTLPLVALALAVPIPGLVVVGMVAELVRSRLQPVEAPEPQRRGGAAAAEQARDADAGERRGIGAAGRQP